MASPRPLYRDAMTTLAALPKQPNPFHGLATLGNTTTTSIASFDSTTSPALRLPSTRPLDYRWDQSRALLFSKYRDGVRDYRWSRDKPVTFPDTPASRRGYPSTKGKLFRTAQPARVQGVKKEAALGSMNAVDQHSPELQGSVNLELQEERALRKKNEEAHAQAMRESQQRHKDAMAAQETQLKKLQLVNAELNRRVQAEDELAARGKMIDDQEAALGSTLEQGRRDAQFWAKKELERQFEDVQTQSEDVKSRERRVEMREIAKRKEDQEMEREHAKAMAEIESRGVQLDLDFESQLEESRQMFREHIRIFDNTVEDKYKEWKELALKDVQARKDEERPDYGTYHRLWKNLWEPAGDMRFEAIINRLKQQRDFWNNLRAQFMKYRPPQLTKLYSELNQTLEGYFESHEEQLESLLHSVYLDTKEWRRTRTALMSSSHISRTLTRYHRFDIAPNSHDATEALEHSLWESPVESMITMLRHEIRMINVGLDLAKNVRVKQALLQSRKRHEQALPSLQYWAMSFRRDGRAKALRALRDDPLHEKALHFSSQKLRDEIEDAIVGLNDYRKNSGKMFPKQASALDGLDAESRQLRAALVAVEFTTRQRIMLDQYLGASNIDEQELNRKIDEEIAKTESDRHDLLQKAIGMRMPMVGTGAIRRRDRAPAEGLASFAFKRVEQTAVKPSTTVDLRIVERHLAEVNKRLRVDSYASDEAKQRDVKLQNHLRLRYNRMLLAKLGRIRAAIARTSGVHASKVKDLDFEIARLEPKVSAHAVDRHAAIESPIDSKPAGDQHMKSEPGTLVDGTKSHSIIIKTSRRKRRRLSSKSQAMRGQSPESSSPGTTAPSPASSTLGAKESGGKASSKVQSVGFGIASTDEGMPSTSIRRAPDEDERVARPGSLNIAPTASRQMVFMAIPTNDERWEATPAAAPGLDLSTLIDSFSLVNLASQASGSTSSAVHEEDEDASAGIEEQSMDSHDISSIAEAGSVAPAIDTSSHDSITSTADKDDVDSLYQPSETQDSQPANTSSMKIEDDGEQNSAPSTAGSGGGEAEYRISPEDYRKAVLASQSTNAAYWTYKLYKNAAGHSPTIHYCTTYEQADVQAKHFLNQSIVGFDLEWEFGASPERHTIKECISLIQIASEDRIGLFHLAMFRGETADELLPPSLRAILESRDIAKAGVNVAGDTGRLQKTLNVDIAGYFELSHLYRVVTYSETAPREVNRKLYGLAAQVQNVLLLPLLKGEVRTSAWSKKLRMDQTEYAANDAYAGFQLYRALEAKRKVMNPLPPRPAYWEEHQPLVLGDGRKMVAKAPTSKGKGKALAGKTTVEEEDEDDEDQEFFDAVESMDEAMLDPAQTAGVPLAGLSVFYPTLPKLDSAENSSRSASKAAKAEQDTPAGPSKPTGNKRQGPPPSKQVGLAETWVASWRTSLPAEYNLKVGHATLRAYHLWHEQNLSCTEVASLLRDPPLSPSTIASYVMQALQHESLPYDVERVREVLAILPKAAHGRYYKIVNQVHA